MSLWTEFLGLPFELRQVDVKGVPTRSLRAGKGRPVLFLHGISGHLEAFMRTAPAHVAAGFEVHLIDMLGHGYTGKPDVDYTVDRLARHVLDYLDVHGIDQVDITGISLGGWVVSWLLVHHADRINRATMVLAAGNPAMGSPQVAKMLVDGTTSAVMSDDREYTRKRLELVIHNKALITDELVDVRYTIYHQPEFRARLPRMLNTCAPEMYKKFMLDAAALASVEREVLLVWSEEDAYSDVTGAGHFVDNLPHNKLVVFKDAGHWPPFERPLDFARINAAFINGGLAAVEAGAV